MVTVDGTYDLQDFTVFGSSRREVDKALKFENNFL